MKQHVGTARQLKVVFLDAGGTLWPDRWPAPPGDRTERISRLRQRLPGLTAPHAGRIIDALSDLDHPAGPRQQTARLVEDALRRCGPADDVPVEAVIEAMCLPAAGRVQPFPGAQGLLSSLAAKPARVLIASNVLWRRREAARRDFEHYGLDRYVSDYLMSIDIGWRKPDPHFFDAAMAAGGAAGHQCAMVGDSEVNDIAPAVARGMLTVRVAIEEPPPATTDAHFVCTSLDQVADVLSG